LAEIEKRYAHLALVPLPNSGRIPAEIALSVSSKSAVEAISRSCSLYFTGIPCKHGHLSERYLANRQCVECRFLQTLMKRKRLPTPRKEVPTCLHSDNRICLICPRKERCAGAGGTNLLTRVQLAFPNWEPFSRNESVRRKLKFYKPSRPCNRCGKAAWRRVLDNLCSGCQL